MYVVLAVCGFVELLRSAGAFEVVVATPPRMLCRSIRHQRHQGAIHGQSALFGFGWVAVRRSVLTFFFHKPLPSGAKAT